MRGFAPACLAVVVVTALTACGAPPSADDVGTTSSATSTAFANDQTAYDYFVGKGLTNFQAAGIVGNLDQESGVDPTAVESGGPGRGIAQWSVGGRWDTDSGDNVLAYATQQGESSSSLTLQMDFIWFELTTFSDYGLASLQASTNVTDATVAFETDFEGCTGCDQSTRISYAESVLAAYGATVVIPPDDAGSDAGTKSHDAGTATDAGAHAEDSGVVVKGEDGGPAIATDDAGAPVEPHETPTPTSGPTSCAMTNRPSNGAPALWMLGIGFVVIGLRRRRAKS